MKKILIGADYFPPYQYIDDDGSLKGSDYEFIKSIFKKMNYDCEFIIDDWNMIENKFLKGKIDVAFQVQKTTEREKAAFFSNKLREAKTSVVTNNKEFAKSFKSFEDILEKYKIAVIDGYKYGDFIDNLDEKYMKYLKNDDVILKYLDSTETRFAILDKEVFNNIRNLIDTPLYDIEDFEFGRELFVMFKDEKLRDEFNKYLV